MNDIIQCGKRAARFFAVLTVMLTALCPLVYGISYNAAYKRYVGRITDISATDSPDDFTVTYEFDPGSGTVREEFHIFDFQRDRYSVGDEYVLYYSEDGVAISEWDAKDNFKFFIIFPLVFFAPAFIAVLAALLPWRAKSEQIIQAARAFPICSGLSVISALLPVVLVLYAAFNYEESVFGELALIFGLAAAVKVCIDGLIVQTIAWIIFINIKKKRLDIREVGNA